MIQTVKASTGKHSLLLVTQNFGLPLKDVMMILGVHDPFNDTRVYEIKAYTEPTRTLDFDDLDGRSSIIWNHTRLGFLSKKTHNISISVNQSCTLSVGGLLFFPWKSETEPGYWVAKTLLNIEFS